MVFGRNANYVDIAFADINTLRFIRSDFKKMRFELNFCHCLCRQWK